MAPRRQCSAATLWLEPNGCLHLTRAAASARWQGAVHGGPPWQVKRGVRHSGERLGARWSVAASAQTGMIWVSTDAVAVEGRRCLLRWAAVWGSVASVSLAPGATLSGPLLPTGFARHLRGGLGGTTHSLSGRPRFRFGSGSRHAPRGRQRGLFGGPWARPFGGPQAGGRWRGGVGRRPGFYGSVEVGSLHAAGGERRVRRAGLTHHQWSGQPRVQAGLGPIAMKRSAGRRPTRDSLSMRLLAGCGSSPLRVGNQASGRASPATRLEAGRALERPGARPHGERRRRDRVRGGPGFTALVRARAGGPWRGCVGRQVGFSGTAGLGLDASGWWRVAQLARRVNQGQGPFGLGLRRARTPAQSVLRARPVGRRAHQRSPVVGGVLSASVRDTAMVACRTAACT